MLERALNSRFVQTMQINAINAMLVHSIGVESDGKRVLSSEGCRSLRCELLGIALNSPVKTNPLSCASGKTFDRLSGELLELPGTFGGRSYCIPIDCTYIMKCSSILMCKTSLSCSEHTRYSKRTPTLCADYMPAQV